MWFFESLRVRRLLTAALACGAVLASPALAGAQGSPEGAPPETEDRSRKLFEEASRLADEGKLKEACPLFRAAHDIHATGGTTLRLAYCYEKLGQKREALALYESIVADRDKHKPERVATAEGRVAVLKQELEREKPAGTAEPQPKPADVVETPPSPGPIVKPEPPAETPPNRTPGYAVLAGGGALLALGGVFGVLALSDAGKANDLCNGPCPKDQIASVEDTRSGANTKAMVSNIGLGLGAVGVVVGVVLLVTAKGKPAQVGAVRLTSRGASFRF